MNFSHPWTKLPWFALILLAVVSLKAYAAEPIRAVFLGDSFTSSKKIDEILGLLSRTELNGVVLNTKNDHGTIVLGENARREILRLKTGGAYVICRVVVFHDNIFPNLFPEAALKSKSSGGKLFWRDGKKWIWIDPLSRPYIEYLKEKVITPSIEVCDEINLDYIRFPSPIDGDLKDALYPLWSTEKMPRRKAIQEFLKEIRLSTPRRVKLSVDLFGYAFLSGREEGIGQHLEDFAPYVDIISPMAYPTHYSCFDKNFGIADPSFAPYEVYKVTLARGIKYLRERGLETKIRPWIQAFTIYNICRYTKKGCPEKCGIKKAEYGRGLFREQIRALENSKDPAIIGWMAWNPHAYYPVSLFNLK